MVEEWKLSEERRKENEVSSKGNRGTFDELVLPEKIWMKLTSFLPLITGLPYKRFCGSDPRKVES